MSSAPYEYPVRSQLVSEYLGSFFLVLAAISPIILFHQVLDSGIALAVLVDALAVGFVLFALTTRDDGNYIAEVLGTFLLVLCIFMLIRNQSDKIPLAIGMLVGEMLIATSSTMFANPQVTVARMFTYSAAGIRPLDGLIFIIMEILGAILAVLLCRLITNGSTAIKPLKAI